MPYKPFNFGSSLGFDYSQPYSSGNMADSEKGRNILKFEDPVIIDNPDNKPPIDPEGTGIIDWEWVKRPSSPLEPGGGRWVPKTDKGPYSAWFESRHGRYESLGGSVAIDVPPMEGSRNQNRNETPPQYPIVAQATKRRWYVGTPATKRRGVATQRRGSTGCSSTCEPNWETALPNKGTQCSLAKKKQICNVLTDMKNCLNHVFSDIWGELEATFCNSVVIYCSSDPSCNPHTDMIGVPFLPHIRLCDPSSFSNIQQLKLDLIHELAHAACGNELDDEAIENICGTQRPGSNGFAGTQPTPGDFLRLCQDANINNPEAVTEKWNINNSFLGIREDIIAGKWFAVTIPSGKVYRLWRDSNGKIMKMNVRSPIFIKPFLIPSETKLGCQWGSFPIFK